MKDLKIFVLYFFLMLSFFSQAQNKVDSLLETLKKNPPIADQINIYKQLHQLQFQQVDSMTAVEYLNKALLLAQETDSKAAIFELKSLLGKFFWYKGSLHEALLAIQEANKLEDFVPDSKLIAENYSNLGLIHYSQGEYEKSVEAHLESIKLFELSDDKSGIAKGFNNLGIVFQMLKDYDKALDYHQRSLEICEQENIQPGIAHNLGNIGIIYRQKKEYDKAISAYTKSLAIHKTMGSQLHISTNLVNLGNLYEARNELNKAKDLYNQSLVMREEIGYKDGMASSLIDLGIVNSKLGLYAEARENLNKALLISTKEGMKEHQMNIFKTLADLETMKKNYKAALEHRLQYESLKDSIITENHLNKIKDLELGYETEKKEKELLRLSQENIIHKASLEQKNSMIAIITLVFVLIVITLISLFLIYKQRSLNKQQFATIEAIADTQEKERSRVARDLHDSIGTMLSTVKHQLTEYENIVSNTDTQKGSKYQKSMELLEDAYNEVRKIAHNMTPGVLMKFGLDTAINSLVNQTNKENSLNAKAYVYNLEKRLDVKTEALIYRILQELIHNVLKHAKAQNLAIHLTRHDHKVNLIVEDDGIGFNPEINGSEGIGLKNIQSRIEHLKGTFNIDSLKGRGTQIIIELNT